MTFFEAFIDEMEKFGGLGRVAGRAKWRLERIKTPPKKKPVAAPRLAPVMN